MKESYFALTAALLSFFVMAAVPVAAAEPKPDTTEAPTEREPGAKTSAARSAAPGDRGKEPRPGPATRPGDADVHAVESPVLLSKIQLVFDERALARHRISGDAAADAVFDLLDRLHKKRGGMFLLEDFEGAQVTIDGKTFAVRDLGKVRVTFFREEPVPNREQVEDLKLWSCPKHPKILTNKPGTCPICRMELQRTTLEEVERLRRHEQRTAPQEK